MSKIVCGDKKQVTIDELESYIHREIPLTRAMHVRVTGLDEAGLTLAAPLEPNINDKGTAFAGSIATLLTLSGWALLHTLLDAERTGLRVAVTDSRLTYTRPVAGDFRAVCAHPGMDAIDSTQHALTAQGKARIALQAHLFEGDTMCATLEGTYAVLI